MISILTISYPPDLPLFEDLQASVARYTAHDVVHQVVVDDESDRQQFQRFAGPRCRIDLASEVRPGRFWRVPRRRLWVNTRRPWPPVRGWVHQQVLKIGAVGASDADLVLLLDSDVALVRSITAENFQTDGQIHFFGLPGGVHDGMTRHVIWHEVARKLLGLPPAPPPPLPDYVDSFNIWSPELVRGMCARIEQVTGLPWVTALASNLHISEFILYGVYVDEVLGKDAPVHHIDRMPCHNYWDEVPLGQDDALKFASSLAPSDLAMMISAKSETELAVRRMALKRAAEVAEH